MFPILRQVLHVDVNNFYASVECLVNPKIRNSPVAVCGDAEARHGIVLAKNQIAKAFGISTGEAIWQAKQKCPNLVTVPANFSLYLKFSKLAKSIFRDYTDKVESFGVDEAWMDVTGSVGLFGSGEKIANEIRHRIYQELGVTVSVGVSWNKIYAKLGSDMKKPNATTIITKENYKQMVWCLPASDLLYVGRATAKKLSNFCIRTIGDLANADPKFLYSHLGKWGIVLSRFANGDDFSPVTEKGEEAFIKSVGNSITSPRDLQSVEDVKAVMYMLSDSVAARLRGHGLKCSTVQIYVRNNRLASCERQEKLEFPTFISSEIAEKAMDIFIKKYRFQTPIRSVGVRGTNLMDQNTNVQLSLFSDIQRRDRMEALEKTVDEIRGRFGYHAIQKGIHLVDKQLSGINPKDEHVLHPVNFFDGAILG